jgi:predicted nucleic acid-binding Zn ribbon protein
MTKQQHYPPTCPVCGASLPHDNPMSKQFHEQRAAHATQQCPVCHAANPSDEHLLWEYKEMMLAQHGAFKNNAQAAQNEVAALLFERGITSIPNIFGDIPIQKVH